MFLVNILQKDEDFPFQPKNEIATQPQIACRSDNHPQIASRRDNPIYEHFFKMLDVGVPEQAVRLKMQLQGLDDSVLDDCNWIHWSNMLLCEGDCMLYILISLWVLHTPNADQNQLFNVFHTKKLKKRKKSKKIKQKMHFSSLHSNAGWGFYSQKKKFRYKKLWNTLNLG